MDRANVIIRIKAIRIYFVHRGAEVICYAAQKMDEQKNVIKALKEGANVVLAEIVFDHVIGEFQLGCGKDCFESYSEKYKILSDKMVK